MNVRYLRFALWLQMISNAVLLTWALLAAFPGVTATISELVEIGLLIVMSVAAMSVTWFFLRESETRPWWANEDESGLIGCAIILRSLGDVCMFAGLTVPFAIFLTEVPENLGSEIIKGWAGLVFGGAALKAVVNWLVDVPEEDDRSVRFLGYCLPAVCILSLLVLAYD